ncbi:MAG: thioesterase family protein [Actinomycetota bacterium]|jgi:acyl-CoA thioester hydrolase|nr:thioesterase family protein [Actinomycetota bacterium]
MPADASPAPRGPTFTHRLRARFAETDAMGVIHHAAYLGYLEAARVELLRAVGHPYDGVRASGIDFAVVDVQVHYMRPVVFDDQVAVELWVRAASRAAFEIAYVVRVGDRRCATAVTRHAAVGPDGHPRRLPAWVTELAASEEHLPRR